VKKNQLYVFAAAVIMMLYTATVAGQDHRLTTNGWRITAHPEKAALTIEYEPLGVVLDDVQLLVKQGDEWHKLLNWQVTAGDRNMQIHTDHPDTDWSLYIRNRVLGLSTSVSEGLVRAAAPAGKNRFTARMIDYSGSATPVAWNGTNEIEFSYGGNHTKNISFLPADNPDVLYLSLGQVSSRNMHCLFDRTKDIMIKFHDQTKMSLSDENDPLQVSIPLGPPMMPGGSGADLRMVVIYTDYYTEHLGLPVYVPMDEGHFKNPPVLWNSWTNYYYLVTEDEVIRNVDWIVEHFSNYGLEYVVIDDGPERGADGEHYWISNWNRETFPHGGKWLAGYVRSKGLIPGLWVVPNVYAGALSEHPDWYLRDHDGKHVMVYHTPALDYTHPGVLDHLRQMFSTLKDWGFEYYKFDGEFALTEYIPYVDRDRLYDKNISQIEAYRNRLEVIRDIVGKGTFLEGCPGGTPLQGIGYFNSYFNGEDIYNSWLGMYPFFISINANLFLNHIVCYLMPGEGICVSPKMDIEEAKSVFNPEFIRVTSSRETDISSVGTTMNEARTIVTFASLSGTPYSFADRLPDLPEERIDLLKKTLPALPIVPMDLFSRGGYSSWGLFKEFTPETYEHNLPRIVDLKINAASGLYDVVAATNWTNESQLREISFEDKLGLDPEKSYQVFDFWNQEWLGTFDGSIKLDIEPHDTRVLLIRPLFPRPQLLATDRHISGAYSLESLAWDAEKHALKGSSKTIGGKPYSLFVHVPDEFVLSKIQSEAEAEPEHINQHVLKITMMADKNLTDWSIIFKHH
jgi:hypothetical protein